MLNQTQLSRVLIELLLLLLGILVALLATTGRYAVPHHSASWMGLSGFLIYWGLRAWRRRGRFGAPWASAATVVRGGSLVLVGAVMLAMVWLPFRYAAWLLVVAGGILALRGLAGLWLATRP